MEVTLYTWSACSHCARARALLVERGIAFREEPLDERRDLRRDLAARLGRADMPFALVDGELLGGVDDLRRRLDEGAAD